MIEGRIQTRSWQNSAGQKINRTEIIAERVQLGPKSLEKVNQNNEEQVQKEEIPVIEEEEIDIKDIPL
jgi:single-stranded DNA-binding protein